MNLKTLICHLNVETGKEIQIRLPSGDLVAPHFHITEMGIVTKNFTDCGGTERCNRTCVFQVWVANDYDHRVTTDKLNKIIKTIDNILLNCLDVYFEIQRETISLYKLKDISVKDNHIIINLENTKTECLAPDKCGVKESCCSGNGCC
jgi:hypothetical protein